MNPLGNEIVVYQPDDTTRLEVRLAEDTVWLTQEQMAGLFQRDRSVVNRHVRNIFAEGELPEKGHVHFLHIPSSGEKRARPSFGPGWWGQPSSPWHVEIRVLQWRDWW